MGKQLTTPKTCKQKHTYHSQATATRAKKRRNKAAGIDYLRSYRCNLGYHWHVTTQVKNPEEIATLESLKANKEDK
jgi:hypothetical protein